MIYKNEKATNYNYWNVLLPLFIISIFFIITLLLFFESKNELKEISSIKKNDD